MDSWHKITNSSTGEFYVVSDGKLSDEDAQRLNDIGFKIFGPAQDAIVNKFLENYPSLKRMRERGLMWRKLIDPMIHLQAYERVIIIDTDVLVQDYISFPDKNTFDIAYMRDDGASYVGNWKMVWQQQMIPALNAGFIVVNPKIIDFDYLEQLTEKFILHDSKDTWLTEQTAWACIAGRTPKRLLLKGDKARVLTGMISRPLDDILNNRFRYYVGKKMIEEFEKFKPLLAGASIIHFPNAKKCIMDCIKYLATVPAKENVMLDGYAEHTMSMTDKIMVSMKLFLKRLNNKRWVTGD